MLVGIGRLLSRAASSASAFSPADVTTSLWLDVSDLGTLFVERSSPTTPASVNGVVGTILDKSGNGRHFAAVADASRPILRQSGALYYLEFDGTDDRLEQTVGTLGSIVSASAFEIHVGINFPTIATDSASPWLNDAGFGDSGGGYFAAPFVRSSGVMGGFNFDGSTDVVSDTYAANTVAVWSQRHAGGTLYGQINSAAEVSVASGNTQAAGLSGIARFSTIASGIANVHLYGAVFTSSAFTADERTSVRAYLAAKSGVAL